jgi:hypothetical protein
MVPYMGCNSTEHRVKDPDPHQSQNIKAVEAQCVFVEGPLMLTTEAWRVEMEPEGAFMLMAAASHHLDY